MPGVRLALRPEFDVTQERPAGCPPDGPARRSPGHRARRDPRPEPADGGPVRPAARLAQPARVRLRRDRGGQVADRAVPARGRGRAAHPVAGGRARQGRVPADGRATAGRGGDQDQAGRARRDRGRAQPARARGRSDRRQVPSADARGPGPSAVHRVLQVRGAVPAGAQRRPRPGLRGRGLGPRARRAGRRRRTPPPTRPSPPCSARPNGSSPRSATPSGSPTTCSASSGSGWPASGTARPAASSRAGTRSISARCWPGTWCSRSRTSATTRTRRF